jgi:CHASE1-domain containing sensor protein
MLPLPLCRFPTGKFARDNLSSLGLAIAVLALSLGLTVGVWYSAQEAAKESLQAEFDYNVREITNRVGQRVSAYEYVLRSAQAFFTGSVDVSRGEFRAYVASLELEKAYPGAKGIGYAKVVPHVDKAQYIANMRKQGFSDYSILPEGERSFYTPVYFREPLNASNHVFLGYDLYSESSRRDAMEKARDSGAHAISDKLTLFIGEGVHRPVGFIMFYPIYDKSGLATSEERRRHIAGWVYTPVHMAELMKGLLGEREAELDVKIFDGELESEATLLFDTNTISHSIWTESPRLKAMRRLKVGSHTWTIGVHSLQAFEARLNNGKPMLIAIAGSVLSVLMAMLTYLLASGRMRALSLASRMNRDLHESEERYSLVMEGSDQGFWD